MNEDRELSYETKLMCALLDSVFVKLKSIDEKMECILHTVCKNDDEKTQKAISSFLGSNFRNRNG